MYLCVVVLHIIKELIYVSGIVRMYRTVFAKPDHGVYEEENIQLLKYYFRR